MTAEVTLPETALAADGGAEDLTAGLGKNLRRIRTRRGLSLERLAKLAGVSRAMLSQIELGQSTPTIGVLWKIGTALGVPFSALLSARATGAIAVQRSKQSKVLTNQDGTFRSRALFPYDSRRTVEFYELHLTAGAAELAEPHAPGTTEHLAVTQGAVVIEVDGERTALEQGDSIVFQADVPHAYRNLGATDAVMYLVMTYAEPVG